MLISELCENGDLYDYIVGAKFSLTDSSAQRLSSASKARSPPHAGYRQRLGVLAPTRPFHYPSRCESYAKSARTHLQCKSTNILITRGGVAKVGDFGLARVKHSTRSMIRSLVGTVNWQAPELWHPNPRYDYKVDVFSAALVYWEMLSGWAGEKVCPQGKPRLTDRNTLGRATMSIISMMLWARSTGDRRLQVCGSIGVRSQSIWSSACGTRTPASDPPCRMSLRTLRPSSRTAGDEQKKRGHRIMSYKCIAINVAPCIL